MGLANKSFGKWSMVAALVTSVGGTSAFASEVFVCALQKNAENWGGIGKFKQTAPKRETVEGKAANSKQFVGYKCTSLDREEYYLRFRGYSIAIAWQPDEGLILSFLGYKDGTRKDQDKQAHFYGGRVSATILGGVTAMAAGNHRGLMVAFGLNTGIGFDVSAIDLEFGRASAYSELRDGNVTAVPASEKYGTDPLNIIRTGDYANIRVDEKTSLKLNNFSTTLQSNEAAVMNPAPIF